MTRSSSGTNELRQLADEYEAGLQKMVASGYEEFGPDVQRKHRMVIDALRYQAGGVAQRQPEPAMWVCLVTPKGEHEEPHIRAWTTSAERAKRFAQLEGLEMRPLYASPVPSTALGGEAK
jgi:hypothetical protein